MVSIVKLAFTSIGRSSLDIEGHLGGDVPLIDMLVHATIEVKSGGCPMLGVCPFGKSPVHATIHVDSNVSISPLVIEPQCGNPWKMFFHHSWKKKEFN